MHARISRIDRTRVLCLTSDPIEVDARVPKRLRAEHPCVGDLVELDPPPGSGPHVVRSILPRRSLLQRGTEDGAQPLAANVDVALICTALDGDYSDARIERYVALATSGGVRPILVLTKGDLHEGPPPRADALVVSARTGVGLDALREALSPGTTAALLGSSGAGKSTLVNVLLGEDRMATQPVRDADDKGRHTTTHRELLRLPWGAWLIDAPGPREVGLAGSAEGAYAEVDALARGCRFSDCAHDREPGCAVRGAADPARLDAWRKLQREAAASARTDAEARAHARRAGREGRDTMRGKQRLRDG